MRKRFCFIVLLSILASVCMAQEYNELREDGTFISAGRRRDNQDSLQKKNKEIPKGLKVWTIDDKFGDSTNAIPDTLSHMFPNTVFTTGLRGEFNTTGNVGNPRINRIFTDRPTEQEFIFTQSFDYFITPVNKFHFTNTYSPVTNLTYNTCGNRTNGEDHFKALFAVNAGKNFGAGFKFDYIYGRGYYQDQSTSLFDYTMYASYTGDRYQAHFLTSLNHQKQAENGGITNDNYITHPESFNDNYSENEIPTVLSQNWNRNDNQHVFLTHRYNIGFNRKVPMTEDEIKAKKFAMESQKENEALKAKQDAARKAKQEGRKFDEKEYDDQRPYEGRPDDAKIAGNEPKDSISSSTRQIGSKRREMTDSLLAVENKAAEDTAWTKNEYVPVTSFIHTLSFDNYRRLYTAYNTPENYYANLYGNAPSDSINDKTTYYELKNTFAIALLEGFNKWAKAGLKAFITHDLRHYTLPDSLGGTSSYNRHGLFVGGQLSKTEGKTLHYNITGEFGIAGNDAGDVHIKAEADINFKLFGDTIQLAANGFFSNSSPTFYYTHYHSRHFWWDNDNLDKLTHSRIEGTFSLKRTRTQLRIAFDEIKNYTYFGQSYSITDKFERTNNEINVRQCGDAISLFTASLSQDFTFGPINWETVVTYQKSSKKDILPVPDLNIYTNLYLKFKIAKVLKCDLGADLRYFTQYHAPDYAPGIGQFTIQENENSRVKIGNYPIINVYANFHLRHTRFFIMMSHVNAGSGNKNYFFTPHYPLNGRVLRLGVSWNFFN